MPITAHFFETTPCDAYSKLSTLLKPGDLLFCSGEALGSRLIEHKTHSPFSHVGLILTVNKTPEWVVLESIESIGVRCVTLKEGYFENFNGEGAPYFGSVVIGRVKEMSPEKIPQLTHAAFARCGNPYNSAEILEIGSRLVDHDLGLKHAPKIKTKNATICSEFVAFCFRDIGIHFRYNALGFISPGDIAKSSKVIPVTWVPHCH